MQALLDALSAHACLLDEAGVVQAVNEAWLDFAAQSGGQRARLGVGADYLEACAHAVQQGGADADLAVACLKGLLAVIAGRRPRFEMAYPCQTPQRPLWFQMRASRIAGPGPLRILVLHEDITPLKLVQDTLARSDALLRDLTASIPAALFRFVTGPTLPWRFVYMSPGVRTLFELEPALACSDEQALRDCILPEDRPAHDASIRAAVARHGVWEHEYRIRSARSGTLRWVHASAQPRFGEAGAVVWTGVLSDVTPRRAAEVALRASERTYRTLFETVPQGVVYHAADGRITAANPAAQRILGLSLDQLQGRHPVDPRWRAQREDGSDFPGDQHPAMQCLRSGAPVRDVVMGVTRPDEVTAWIQVNAVPLFEAGQLCQVYASFEDITHRVQLAQELQRQARTDELTGLANRRQLMAELARAFERLQRHPDTRCAVVALDVDHFKCINDQWGHAAGDAVLRELSQRMRGTVRQLDLPGRSGGEEFLLLLPDTAAAEAQALAERLRRAVAEGPVHWQGQALAVTVSLGVSVMDAADASLDDALARADRALYAAKHAGRNTVRLQLPRA